MGKGYSLAKRFMLRYIILIPMAYCIYIAVANGDMYARLAAILALIILEQIRDWSLLSVMGDLRRKGKKEEAGE